jgi:WD40 repeat protein
MNALSTHALKPGSRITSRSGTECYGLDDGSILIAQGDAAAHRSIDACHDGHILSIDSVLYPELVVASGGVDGQVRLFDVNTSRTTTVHSDRASPVTSVSMMPSRTMFCSAGFDRCVRLWDLESQVQIREHRGHTGGILKTCLVVEHKDQLILSSSTDDTVKLWDARAPQHVGSLCLESMAFDMTPVHGIHIYAMGCQDGCIRFCDLRKTASASALETVAMHSKAIMSLCYDAQHDALLSGSRDRTCGLVHPHQPPTYSPKQSHPVRLIQGSISNFNSVSHDTITSWTITR